MTKFDQLVADIQWSKVRWNGLLVSLGLMFISIVLISTKGFTLGLEFTGGISHVVNTDIPVTLEAMQSALNTVFDELPNLVPDVTYQTWQLQFPIDGTGELELLQWLRAVELELGHPLNLVSSSVVGAQVGEQLFEQGGLALLVASIAIMFYLTVRFEWRLALGAIVALLHDVLVVLALFVLFSIEFNLTALAALLAVVGYSLNDSIVIGDRIREYLTRRPNQSTSESTDQAIRASLFRTLVTSGTTLLTVSSIGLIAGGTLSGFAFALFAGIIVGTWSSLVIGTAIPERIGLSADHYKPKAPLLDEGGHPIHSQ
ncbi:Protein-export membrane protein SecF [Vibrio crassostreae]|uniref:protein translocase subunit SecF n=1 Tax=Vibrio crassostreae TaxID=246167 RepID=UPI000FB653BB|nr:protein translocase subunit SecF [Vibrio crassostreae]ROO57661.1 preprotein translocase subunit SecF [Vibrio crassostreae]TCN99089.1 preprotein translocase subunit SecF [Vibrio crassostreae]TCV17809.1 preprotein translocase subunit SecF [Vibrio crassostreae]TCW10963.1 preprotein translocase subunit SecF [Vibrio crassostreae]CAK3258009.1 Protein-export membrane protein SecF [Vibrio crassostreae]